MGIFNFEEYFDEKEVNKPYSGLREYLLDLSCLTDIYVSVALALKTDTEEIEKLKLRGLVVMPQEVEKCLKDNIIENRNMKLSEKVKDYILKAEKHIMQREYITINTSENFRIIDLMRDLEFTRFQRFVFIFSLMSEYDRKYERIFAYLQNDINSKFITKGAIISLYEMVYNLDYEEEMTFISGKDINFKILYDILESDNQSVLSASLKLKKRVINYIWYEDEPEEYLQSFTNVFDFQNCEVERSIFKDQVEGIINLVKKASNKNEWDYIINLYGSKSIGKKMIIKNVALKLSFNILFVDFDKFITSEEKSLNCLINDILLETVLSKSVLCFTESKSCEKLNYIIRSVLKYNRMIFILSEEKIKNDGIEAELFSLNIPSLSVTQKIDLWKQIGKGYNLAKDVDIELNANKYILTPGGIKNVLDTAKLNSYYENKNEITQKDIVVAVKQQSPNQIGEYASRINAVFTWDDLVVDEEQKRQMQLISNQLKYRNVVGEEWGFNKKMPYGRGLCALFYGAPGTGKTMAVQVMANELGLDLYRIDLSQMISKYIGETQKNISMLFKKAKDINAMLFFDEADSLFAKRSEVKDSNDRNANAETAHLLQKLEEYEGITILATNYLNNIDDAFKRRIKFIVNFSFPSEEIRYKLWKSILPKEAKVKSDLDFEFFAKQFELSGSSIKEILVNAAYIAAGEHKEISNLHIVEAIKNNYYKNGRILLESDFGEYGDLI